MTRVRVEAKTKVRDWDVEILVDILHNVKNAPSGLKR